MALFGKKKKAEVPVPAVSDDPFGTAAAPQSEPVTSAAPKEPPKPKVKVYADIYTLLLGLSALALVVACVMLYLSVAKYGSNPISGIPRAMITMFGG